MARPRTPTALLEARGAFKKDPARRRAGEPVVTTPAGQAPEHFTELQVSAWREILQYAPPGVITSADRQHVEQLAILLAQYRVEGDDFHLNKRLALIKMLGHLGMNPSDRAKLSIPTQKIDNPFAKFK